MTLWQETGLALSRQSWCDKSARMSLQPPTGKIKPDGEEILKLCHSLGF